MLQRIPTVLQYGQNVLGAIQRVPAGQIDPAAGPGPVYTET